MFRNWIRENADFDKWILFEIARLDDMSTDHLSFDGDTEHDECDEDEFEEECREEIESYFNHEDYFTGIYEEPEDDPDFVPYTVEQWKEDNPEPLEDDYESKEEYQSALDTWESHKQEIEDEFEEELKAWRQEQDRKKREAESDINDTMYDQIETCKEEKVEECKTREKEIVSTWNYNDDEYEAQFNRTEEYVSRRTIYNIWEIIFSGPEGTNSTKLNKGAGGAAIYQNLLLSIKKLMNEYEVNGLKFTPAEPAMGVMYYRFYKQFLSDKFVIIDKSLMIKKSIAEELRIDPKRTNDVVQDIEDGIKNIKNQKANYRNILLKYKKGAIFTPRDNFEYSIGIIYESQNVSIDSDIDDTKFIVYMMNRSGDIVMRTININDIKLDIQPDMITTEKFKTALAMDTSVPNDIKLITNKIKPLAKQMSLPFPSEPIEKAAPNAAFNNRNLNRNLN